MRYQIRYENSLSIIHDNIPSLNTIATHFSKNGYDPLYVYDRGLFSCVITFEDFLHDRIFMGTDRNFIKNYSIHLNGNDIENDFLEDLDIDRLIYIDNGRVVCEVNSLTELPLQNSISKNLMSLRYIDIFYNELYVYFKQFDDVIILCELEVIEFLKNKFPLVNFYHTKCIEKAYLYMKNKINIILIDFLYGKKIRTHLKPQLTNVIDFCKILTKFAMNKIISLSKKRGIELYFYKLPRFQDLSCLHELEYDNFKNRKSMGKLIRDEEYLKLFVRTENEKDFLKKKKYHASQRLDNGYCFVMDESFESTLRVHNNIRRNGLDINIVDREFNFYGPCTTYGFLVEDSSTVPTIIQKLAMDKGIHIKVQNRAGIHGDNELNSLMEALSVPVSRGDAHIFLDVLEELPVHMYPNYHLVKDWFNEVKSKEEIYFLDFPGHCNSDANKIMAQYIFDSVKKKYTFNSEIKQKKQPLLERNIDYFKLISLTHSSYIKQRRIILNIIQKKRLYGKIGAVVLLDNLDKEIKMSLVKKCSLRCKYLFVFSMNHNIYTIEDNRRLNYDISIINPENIILIPTEYFFNISRYFNSNYSIDECYEQIFFVSRVFLKLIQEEIGVNIFFYTNPSEFTLYKEVFTSVKSTFEGKIIEIKL